MSARRATTGESWDTLVPRTMATTPVLANGYSYSTPIRSSSARMSALVFTSSYLSSGCSWMSRLTRFIHSTVSGCRASWSINLLLLSLVVVATPKLPDTDASNINSRSSRSNAELAILTCNLCASESQSATPFSNPNQRLNLYSVLPIRNLKSETRL